MSRRIRAGLTAAVVAGLLAGCGVPVEGEPRTVEPPRGPFAAAGSPTPVPPPEAGTVAQPLYFVRGDRLVAVLRRVRTVPTVPEHVADLVAGPTRAEADAGLASALGGNTVIAAVRLEGTRAVVELDDPPEGGGRSDEVLAVGQVVCTLTARADVATVSFRHEGQPLGVPRSDGSLSQAPLTVADYAALVAPA